MNNNEDKNKNLGTINFLDVGQDGKIMQFEDDPNDFAIPEVENEVNNATPMTDEMQSIVEGTYIENQENARKLEEENKKKREVSKAKFLITIIVLVLVACYGIFSYFQLSGVNNTRDIKEKTEFLTNNAVYANDIKTYYKQLASNADNYQKEIIFEASMKSKAESVEQSINDKLNKLEKTKDDFDKFEAANLYSIIEARLNEAKNLAVYQSKGGEALDIVLNTNEFIINENDNAETYNKNLKEYLDSNKIPYEEEDGALIYDSERAN